MRTMTLVVLLLSLALCGCGAGTTYDMIERDAVISAANEAKKGVVAFNTAVVAGTSMRRAAMVTAVGESVRKAAVKTSTPEESAALAEEVVELLADHLANYSDQERRRAELFEVTIDNLDYIIQISEQGKQLAIYRADIGTQWKAYLQSSTRKYIGNIDTVMEVPTSGE